MGHATFNLALNDPFAEGMLRSENGLRLRPSLPWNQRWKMAGDALAKFAPDFISLQFVCYGFHPRGFCFGLGAKLRAIFGNVPVQILAHELWIGAELGASKKDRLIGAVQRAGVLSTFKRLRPALVHTTNPAYVALLKQNGFAARQLPLFGAIPVEQSVSAPRPDPAERPWRFAMFGSLHPIWPPAPLLERLQATGKKIRITHIGHIGAGNELWARMERDYGRQIEFERLGELSPEGVAAAFAQMDFGIATTPWQLIGKSASVAGMLEHGLPVVVNRDDVHFRGWREEANERSPLLIKMGTDLGQQLASAQRQAPRSIRRAIALQFLNDLKGAP